VGGGAARAGGWARRGRARAERALAGIRQPQVSTAQTLQPRGRSLERAPVSPPAARQVAGPNDQYAAGGYPMQQPGMYTQPYAPGTAFTPAAVPPPAVPVPAAAPVPPGYDPIAVAAGVTLPGQVAAAAPAPAAAAAAAAAPAAAPAPPPAPKEPLPPGLMWRSNMREQIPANASALPKIKVPEVRGAAAQRWAHCGPLRRGVRCRSWAPPLLRSVPCSRPRHTCLLSLPSPGHD
jgi:hypothetical protein